MAINPLTLRDDELENAFGPLGYQPPPPAAPAMPQLSREQQTHAPTGAPVAPAAGLDRYLATQPEELPPMAPALPTAPVAPPPGPGSMRPVLAAQQVTSQSAHPEVLKASKSLDQVAAKAEGIGAQQGALDAQKAVDNDILLQQKLTERDTLTAANEDKKQRISADIQKGADYLAKKTADHENYKITDWIDDQTDGTRLQTSLAVGLGAFGAALSGGENQALRIVEGVIARDRQRKLSDLQKLEGQKEDASGALDKSRDRLTLADVELRASHDALFKHLETERAAKLAKFGSPQAAIDSDKYILGVREMNAKNKAEMFKGLETTVTKQYATPSSAGADGPGGLENVSPENIVAGPGGKPMFAAANKELAQRGRDLKEAYQNISTSAAKLDEQVAQGRSLPGSDRSSKMAAIQKGMLLELKNFVKAGALDEGMIKVAEDMIPKDAGVLGNNRAGLTEFRSWIREKTKIGFESLGTDGDRVIKVLDSAPAAMPGNGAAKPASPLSRSEEARLRQEYTASKDPARRAAIAGAIKASRG